MMTRADLSELVMNHLGRATSPERVALATACDGLARIFAAYTDAQERRGNWGSMIGNLRTGIANLDQTLPKLREQPGAAAIVAIADTELGFARELLTTIETMQGGETTLV